MAAFTLCAGATALADPTDPSIPSQEQVDAAKAQVGDAATRVSAINATLDAADQRLRVSQSAAGMAAERYNAAVLELTRRTAAAEAAKTAAATARGQADDAQLTVDDLAAQIYMSGGSLDGMEVLLSATGPDDVAARAAGLDIMTTYRHAVLTDAAVAARRAAEADRIAASAQLQQRAAAEQAKSLADAARAAAEAAAQERAKVAGQQATLIAELATLKNTSAALETQRREGLAAAAARKAAQERAAAEAARIAAEKAAAAKAAAEKAAAEKAAAEKAAAEKAARDKANSGSGNSGSGNSGSGGSGSDSATTDTGSQAPPAPKGGVAAVIAFARAQLGKPYEWGGSGPYAWDCSGLTQAAWRQAGVSIDHYTGSQWAQTSRVPLSQLQPGDLVFYGTAPYNIHHVGLYIGGGQMIHAPTFGVPVQIASIYWDDLIPYGGRP